MSQGLLRRLLVIGLLNKSGLSVLSDRTRYSGFIVSRVGDNHYWTVPTIDELEALAFEEAFRVSGLPDHHSVKEAFIAGLKFRNEAVAA